MKNNKIAFIYSCHSMLFAWFLNIDENNDYGNEAAVYQDGADNNGFDDQYHAD